jgi:hypothetical protein
VVCVFFPFGRLPKLTIEETPSMRLAMALPGPVSYMSCSPHGVFFKPFSDSLKMKILSSDLVSSHSLNWSIRTFLTWVFF